MRIEQTLTSMEVAEMVEKAHKELLRDIRRYCNQLGESKIAQSDFFKESTYQNSQNKTMPCYQITKKGCEFIAHKLTGTKGTAFTARYINRFHDMEKELQQGRKRKQPNEIPWFIREFNGRYVILVRDFSVIIGMDIMKYKKIFSLDYYIPGKDWNGYGWKGDNEEFKKKYGFDYGNEKCLLYMTMSGARKTIKILEEDKKAKVNLEACEYIMKGIEKTRKTGRAERKIQESNLREGEVKRELPVQVNIYLESGGEKICASAI